MRRRLLITGAGTGASNNLVRSLRGGDPSLRIVGVNSDRFVLKKSLQTIRVDVRPPCECPSSQNAFTFSRPTCSMSIVTMFCR